MFGKSDDRAVGHVHKTAFLNERPTQRRMMAPCEIDWLSALVCNSLVYSERGLAAPKPDGFDKKERGPYGANFKPNIDCIGFVFDDRITPREQEHFAVLADLRALMHGEIAAVGKHFLPSTLIIVGVQTRCARTGRKEVSPLAKPNTTSPHEIDVERLVKEFENVSSLVGDNRDTELLVLERNAPVALKHKLSDAATVVAVVMISLITHRVSTGAQ